MEPQTFTDGALTLKLFETEDAVRLEWTGMSMARQPGPFLLPILTNALDAGLQTQKRVVIDFRQVEYLNSSSISPVIRVLEHARNSPGRVHVVYDKALKWQALSFTALELFRTADGRIDIVGA